MFDECLKVVSEHGQVMFNRGRMGGLAMDIFAMNIHQLINELTQWFDFSVSMVRHHPVISSSVALLAFVFYYAVSAVKFAMGIISFGLAMVMAFVLQMLMF